VASEQCLAVPNIDRKVAERVEAVRSRVVALRSRFEGRPFLVTTPGVVNWIIGGISDPIDLTAVSDPVWVLETDHCRALLTTEIEAPRIREEVDRYALGWEIVAVPWFEAEDRLRAAQEIAGMELSGFLSDRHDVGVDVTPSIVAERLVLTQPEQEVIRSLGFFVAQALEVGIDGWRPGISTDFDVAAAINAELERQGIRAVCLIVGGDERLRRFRHPLAVGEVISDAIMGVVVARFSGLHVAATRIAVTSQNDPIVELVEELSIVDDSVLKASRPGGTWGNTVNRLARAYEQIGRPGAWREHFQGGPIAYEQREFELAPGQIASPYWNLTRKVGTAIAWNPSLSGGAKIEETQLVLTEGFELLTRSMEWPVIESEYGGITRSRVKVMK